MDDHLSGTDVAVGLTRAYPSVGRASLDRSYLPLLRVGFAKPPRCRDAGALLPHRFSFSSAANRRGVFFSVALSVGSRRPAVSRHPALWSPDFPHASFPRRAAVQPTPLHSLARTGEGRPSSVARVPRREAARALQPGTNSRGQSEAAGCGRSGRVLSTLRLELRPGVLECERSVEHERIGSRVGIRAEVAEALELNGLSDRQVGEVRFYDAVPA